MPQFDLAVFTSQIFWLAVCFLVLYLAMSKIYLPRIKFILRKRERIVDVNTFKAHNLEKEINELNHNSEDLRKSSALQYKIAMDLAVKQIAVFREEATNNFRKSVDRIIDESNSNILRFNEESSKDSETAINKLVENISQKVFNGGLSKEEIEHLRGKIIDN